MQYTYTTLLASCQDYCIDNSPQYIAEFPNIVQIAEMRIIKDLSLAVFDKSVTGNLVAGVNTLVKPSGFIALRSLYIVVSGNNQVLQLRSKSYLDQYWANANNRAQPIYFAELSTTQWQITPTPDLAYAYQANYIARPTPMSPTNIETWIGDKLGELLLPACLITSMEYFREDMISAQGITQKWESEYQTAMLQARKELAGLVSATDQSLKPIIIPGY